MGHWFTIHSLNSNVRAVVFQPIVGDGSKAFGALAAKIVVGELDIGPSVGGESDDAGLSPFVEGGEWKEAHLILLSFVLVIAIFRLIKKMKIQEEISRSQTKQERSNSQDQNVESFEMT